MTKDERLVIENRFNNYCKEHNLYNSNKNLLVFLDKFYGLTDEHFEYNFNEDCSPKDKPNYSKQFNNMFGDDDNPINALFGNFRK